MLTQRQIEIVNGSLLGDGTIWTNFIDPLMKWQFGQSKLDHSGADKRTYMCWFAKEFIDAGVTLRSKKFKKSFPSNPEFAKEYSAYIFTTRCSYQWNEIEAKWYVPRNDHPRFKRRKIVPPDLKLTPLTLCVWHMDDGSNNSKDANIELNTQGFKEEEIEFLMERLEHDLGLKTNKKSGGRKTGQFKIYIGRDVYFDYMDLIKPHVAWDCFFYKYDTSTYNKTTQRGEGHSHSKLTELQVREMIEARRKGMPVAELAELFDTSRANVSSITSGTRWRHVGDVIPVIRKPRVTEAQRTEIITLVKEGLSQPEIARRCNVNQSTVSRILKEKNNEEQMVRTI